MSAASSRAPAPAWQVRIGGRWAISWQAFVVGASFNTLIVGLTGGQIGAGSVEVADIPAWLGIGLLASAAAGLWALIADASFLRERAMHPVPAWQALGFHLGIGIVFASVIVFAGDALVATSTQSAAQRIGVISLIGLWWGVTASLILEARDRFDSERRRLVDEAVQWELASISEADAAMRLRSTVEEAMGPAVDSMRTDLIAALASDETTSDPLLPITQWWRISAALRDTAEASVRPLSHQLWAATDERYAAPRLGRVLSKLVLYQQFAPWPSIVILAVGYLPAGTYALGFWPGLCAAVAMALGAGALLALCNAAMRSVPRLHALVFAVALIVTQAWALGFLAVIDRVAGRAFTMSPDVAGGMIAVALSVVMPAALASLDSSRSEVIDAFRLDTDEVRMRQIASSRQLAIATRSAARMLHGTVQTRLISCAVAIEQASSSGDVEQFRRALETSLAILDAPLPEHESDTSSTLPQEIARMCAPWEGLCAFEVDCDETASSLRGPVALAAGRAVEEGIANACRHGLATHVAITARVQDGPALYLRIEDDGSGPGDGLPGLGTTMLAGMTGGRVALAKGSNGGACLTLELPMDAMA